MLSRHRLLGLIVVVLAIALVASATPGSARRDRTPPVISAVMVTPFVIGGLGGFVGVTVLATDNVGVVNVTVDLVGPAPSNATIGSLGIPLLQGTPQDGTWNGTFVFPVSVGPGIYTAVGTARDAAGNSATLVGGTTYLDLTPPTIYSSSHPAYVPSGDAFSVTATVGDDVGVQTVQAFFTGPDGMQTLVGAPWFSLYYGDGHLGNWSASFAFPSAAIAPEGRYAILIVATDAVGKQASASAGTLYLDRTAPDTVILSAVDGAGRILANGGRTPSHTITFTFEGIDAGGIQAFYCQLDQGWFFLCFTPVTYENLRNGPHTFQVYAVDNAGFIDPTPAIFTWKVRR